MTTETAPTPKKDFVLVVFPSAGHTVMSRTDAVKGGFTPLDQKEKSHLTLDESGHTVSVEETFEYDKFV